MTYEEMILKENIMRRVRFIWGFKRLGTVLTAKFALFAALVAGASFFVSVPNVLRNMPSFTQIGDFSQFVASAFLNTKVFVQLASLAAITLLYFMARDIVRAFRDSRVLAHA